MIRCIYTRRSSFTQYQITDFYGYVVDNIFVMKDMKQYREAIKILKPHNKPRKRGRMPKLNILNMKKGS